jgi:hypothetical protein
LRNWAVGKNPALATKQEVVPFVGPIFVSRQSSQRVEQRSNLAELVEKRRLLWHLPSTMPSNSTYSDVVSKGVFALLLVSVILSGVPMVEVHSHDDATYGHSHGVQDAFDDHGLGDANPEDGAADTASLHAHDISATSLGVVASISVDSSVPRHSHSYIPPPCRWLPDNVISPLYRPPKA